MSVIRRFIVVSLLCAAPLTVESLCVGGTASAAQVQDAKPSPAPSATATPDDLTWGG